MWQLSAVGALIAQALEGVADKAAIVRETHIHGVVASFWRNLLFLFFITLIGYLGFLGELQFVFSWPIVVFAAMGVLSAYFYTYILRKVEVTGVFLETYLTPIAFLVIDLFILKAALEPAQIAGIIILTAGGLAFAFNARTHHIKREFSPLVWAIFMYWLVYDGVQFYLFKYLHDTQSISEIGFLFSVWSIAVLIMFGHLIVTGKVHLLFGKAARIYVPIVTLSKCFDAIGSILWLHALSYVAVSQVAALNALEPFILLGVAYFVQKETRFNIRERLDRSNISWKMAATAFVCVGLFLVS